MADKDKKMTDPDVVDEYVDHHKADPHQNQALSAYSRPFSRELTPLRASISITDGEELVSESDRPAAHLPHGEPKRIVAPHDLPPNPIPESPTDAIFPFPESSIRAKSERGDLSPSVPSSPASMIGGNSSISVLSAKRQSLVKDTGVKLAKRFIEERGRGVVGYINQGMRDLKSQDPKFDELRVEQLATAIKSAWPNVDDNLRVKAMLKSTRKNLAETFEKWRASEEKSQRLEYENGRDSQRLEEKIKNMQYENIQLVNDKLDPSEGKNDLLKILRIRDEEWSRLQAELREQKAICTKQGNDISSLDKDLEKIREKADTADEDAKYYYKEWENSHKKAVALEREADQAAADRDELLKALEFLEGKVKAVGIDLDNLTDLGIQRAFERAENDRRYEEVYYERELLQQALLGDEKAARVVRENQVAKSQDQTIQNLHLRASHMSAMKDLKENKMKTDLLEATNEKLIDELRQLREGQQDQEQAKPPSEATQVEDDAVKGAHDAYQSLVRPSNPGPGEDFSDEEIAEANPSTIHECTSETCKKQRESSEKEIDELLQQIEDMTLPQELITLLDQQGKDLLKEGKLHERLQDGLKHITQRSQTAHEENDALRDRYQELQEENEALKVDNGNIKKQLGESAIISIADTEKQLEQERERKQIAESKLKKTEEEADLCPEDDQDRLIVYQIDAAELEDEIKSLEVMINELEKELRRKNQIISKINNEAQIESEQKTAQIVQLEATNLDLKGVIQDTMNENDKLENKLGAPWCDVETYKYHVSQIEKLSAEKSALQTELEKIQSGGQNNLASTTTNNTTTTTTTTTGPDNAPLDPNLPTYEDLIFENIALQTQIENMQSGGNQAAPSFKPSYEDLELANNDVRRDNQRLMRIEEQLRETVKHLTTDIEKKIRTKLEELPQEAFKESQAAELLRRENRQLNEQIETHQQEIRDLDSQLQEVRLHLSDRAQWLIGQDDQYPETPEPEPAPAPTPEPENCRHGPIITTLRDEILHLRAQKQNLIQELKATKSELQAVVATNNTAIPQLKDDNSEQKQKQKPCQRCATLTKSLQTQHQKTEKYIDLYHEAIEAIEAQTKSSTAQRQAYSELETKLEESRSQRMIFDTFVMEQLEAWQGVVPVRVIGGGGGRGKTISEQLASLYVPGRMAWWVLLFMWGVMLMFEWTWPRPVWVTKINSHPHCIYR
ncbi:hypothetical protein MMC09_000579 [Bachmanniomyces sp. S44760]|nr:hypothetical protein [Bachmanniomyces sp. S44760]